MRVEYREEPCKAALNRVKGMPFDWSLNPYMGCVHRCTFCYVRAFERRADRPSDASATAPRSASRRTSPRCSAASSRGRRGSGEGIAIGAATDPYQPCEGRYRLTRGCLEVLAAAANPFGLITRGPMIVRDLDVLAEAASRADVSVTFSVPTVDEEVWRLTEPGTAPPRQRLRALERLVGAGVQASVGMAPILPGISDSSRAARGGRAGRAGGGRVRDLGRRPAPEAGHPGALPRVPRRGLAGARARVRTALRQPRRTSRTPRSSRSAPRCAGSPAPIASATAAGHR